MLGVWSGVLSAAAGHRRQAPCYALRSRVCGGVPCGARDQAGSSISSCGGAAVVFCVEAARGCALACFSGGRWAQLCHPMRTASSPGVERVRACGAVLLQPGFFRTFSSVWAS